MNINSQNLSKGLTEPFRALSDSAYELGKFIHCHITSASFQAIMLLKLAHGLRHNHNNQTNAQPHIKRTCFHTETALNHYPRKNILENTDKKEETHIGSIVHEKQGMQNNNVDAQIKKDKEYIITPENLVKDICLSLSISMPENGTTEEKFKAVIRTEGLSIKKLNTVLLEILGKSSNLSNGLKNLKINIEKKENNIKNNLISPDAKADLFFSSMLLPFREALKETDAQQPSYKTESSNKTSDSQNNASQEKEKAYNYKERESARGYRRKPNSSGRSEQKSNEEPSFESFYGTDNDFKGFSVKFPDKINSWLESNCEDGLSFQQISDRCVVYSDKDGRIKNVVIRRVDEKFIFISKQHVINIGGDFYIQPGVNTEVKIGVLCWDDKANNVDVISEAWATLSITENKDKNKKCALKSLRCAHPDKNIGNEKQAAENFKKLYKAYEVLQEHRFSS
ncbi:MAG: J domain-containing protein [Candidatus Endonucleobacter bathymodioli]|uniref:J domain-containing protein n=1 Tax=Candidatus Endonucleibacter bathymodioli TaxID=539814 RepID=A0AA90NKD0_9GAMM|nr:J domain-containing protein [Candidatus Endonucleobacter bathymodioli]